MKKVKIGFWILLIAFLLLLGFQNKEFFLQKNVYGIDFYIIDAYMTPQVYNGVAFAVFLLAGLAIAYLFGLFERFRSNKIIKQLNTELESQRQKIETLNTELDAFKNVSAPSAESTVVTDDEKTEAEATQVLS